jgi:DNA end-binding protein Ku
VATSVWRGHISFGLVSIPVRLYRAARAERVKLREVYAVQPETLPEPEDAEPPRSRRSGPVAVEPPRANVVFPEPVSSISPVRRAAIDDAGNQIAPAEVSKGYEVEKGQFVTLSREELRALAPQTSTSMELVEFVSLASVDPVYFETSYYVRPDEGGEKPYALLYRSLVDTGLVGVAQIAMHRREHIVLIRSGKSGLIAHTMYFSSEVRADEEYTAAAEVNPKELALANTLVRALEAEFNPEKFRDTYRERLEQLIAAKTEGQEVIPAKTAPASKPAVDIMEALRKSLAGLKKPPEAAPARDTRARRKRG